MADDGWVKAADRATLGEGDVIGVIVNGQEIALYDIEGQVFATDDICTHAYAKLSDGWFDNCEIGWGSQSVKWQLAVEDGGFKIIDILSAGASLVQMERDTFLSVMRNGGLNQLMAKLDARTKELATAATE